MMLKSKRKQIYLDAAMAEFYELLKGGYVVKKALGFNPHLSLSDTQLNFARKKLPELNLLDNPHKIADKNIREIRTLLYLFAYQMCN